MSKRQKGKHPRPAETYRGARRIKAAEHWRREGRQRSNLQGPFPEPLPRETRPQTREAARRRAQAARRSA